MDNTAITFGALKLMELQVVNFKSFCGRKVFTNFQNFNCILGPNGCGKSNFMDAISFVLGEKTSKLRVKKLEDLIHSSINGSTSVKNPGYESATFAPSSDERQIYSLSITSYVTTIENLTFAVSTSVEATFTAVENETAENVTFIFARIIKQSSSTYFFNNQSISKEDYVAKLKSCGMNVEYPNFLVFQGDIEKIALQNSEELRKYFEYIAGSTGLIRQYEESTEESKVLYNEMQLLAAQKRNTKLVLNKSMSANKEYKLQLEARNDLENKTRLKELICFYYLDKAIKDLSEKLKSAQAKKISFNKELVQIKDNLSKKMEQQKEKSKKVTDIEEKIQEKQKQLNESKLQVVKSKESLNNATEKIQGCQNQIELEANKLKSIHSKKSEISKKLAECEKRKVDYPISKKTEQHMEQYRALKDEAALIRGKRFNIHNEEREDQADHDTVDTLQMQLKALREFIKITEDGKKIASERLLILQETLTSKRIILTNAEVRATDDSIGQLRAKIKKIEEYIHNEREMQATIDESKRDEARKRVFKELKNNFNGVFDRVTNCCNVKENKYKIPLTKVIGNKNMNAIIVDTEVTARRCIEYLKKQRYSPETFLPINYVKVRPYTRVNTTSSSLCLLKDVLVYDKKYENIMSYICNGTYVCSNPTMVQVLYDEKINVVSLEGTFYQRSGFMSGGVADLARQTYRWTAENESARKKEYDNTVDQFKALQQELMIKERQTDDPVDTRQIKAVIAVIEADIKKTERDVATLDQKLAEQNKQMEKMIIDIDKSKTKIAHRETILNEIKLNESKVFKTFCKQLNIKNIAVFENMENAMFGIDTEIQKLEIEKTNEEQLIYNLQEKISSLKAQLPNLEEQRKSVLENHDRVSQNLSKFAGRLDDLKKDLNAKLDDLGETDSSAKAEKKKLNELIDAFDAVRKDYNKVQDNILKHKHQFNLEFTRCNIIGVDIPLLESQGSQDADTDYYNKIVIDYEQIPRKYLGFTNIKDIKFRKLLDTLVEKIHDLQKEIEDIGRNLSKHGISRDEQIESAKVKFASIEEQHTAAVRRYHKLQQDINKLAQERNRRLVHLINNMKTLIKPMYSELTGDTTGNVFLEIENPINPFMGGISFNVIAPEKIYMPLDNLSGGELTMASILLLLTIQKYSRCPILILDEIDAPLDPTNAVKLFRYLGKMSDDLQIFCITHNVEVCTPAQLLVGFTKNRIQETSLKTVIIMHSCAHYEQTSIPESDVSSITS